MKYISIVFIIILFVSCNRNKSLNEISNIEKQYYKSNYFDEERVKKDKFLVTFKGDNHAYGELELYYSYNHLKHVEILPYSLIMVEKFKKFRYCTNLFEDYLEFYSGKSNSYDGTENSLIKYLNQFNELNDDQKKYLIYFLTIGAKKNDYGSIRYLEIINRNDTGIFKNIHKADSLNKLMIKNSKYIFH